MPSGAANSRRRCRTCARKTSPAPVSRSPATRCTQNLGGDAALARLRERLRKRGLRLMLDFVPNHMGLDHPWVEEHPEYFITGTELDLARAPQNYTWVKRKGGDLLLAYGRDPYFAGWPDTLQLNYANPATQEAMIGELVEDRRAVRRRALRHGHAGLAGRVRADLGPACARSSGRRRPSACASSVPGFLFMAEVYWDLEWTLQQQGFDYAYDKRLYDRLRDGHARPVREHFHAGSITRTSWPASWRTTTSRAPRRRFPPEIHQAAAVITFLSPGLRFFHQGQFEGGGNGSRPISSAARTSRSIRRSVSSTTVSWPSCVSRPCATASGNCSNASPPGTATGRTTASWRSPGKCPAASDCWWR